MRYFLSCLLLIANTFTILYGEELLELPQDHCMMLKQQSYEVLGLGDACIDLLIPVTDEFLMTQVPGEKGGAQAIDFDELSRIIQASGLEPQIVTGGSCANAIKGLANLGIKCALLSKIGPDPLGYHYKNYMHQVGVTPLFLMGHHPTARVLCLITPDGQRTMRFFAGSSCEMSEKHIHKEYLEETKIVHMEAYSLRSSYSIERVAKLAKEKNAIVSLDLSSFEIIHQFHPRILQLLDQYVDILFANEDEVKALTGLDPYEGCVELQKKGLIAVVLMGKEGCLVGHRGKIFHSSAFVVNAIDTTGAGDLFASGFLYGHLHGWPLERSARLGNFLGGAVTEVTGAELPQHVWSKVSEKIKNDEL